MTLLRSQESKACTIRKNLIGIASYQFLNQQRVMFAAG